MDKRQTPLVERLDNWLNIVQIPSRLLFIVSQEIKQISCPVWQKYLPKNKTFQDQPQQPLTIDQTQRAAHLLFSTFDPTPLFASKAQKRKRKAKGQNIPSKNSVQCSEKK